MQRLTLLVAVLLLQLVIACGDGGTQTPTTPPTPANRAPAASAAIPDQSVEEGTQAAVNVAGAFSDPDGDALHYEATSDASSVATASVSGSDVTVTGEAPGSATITVTATDPGGLSAIQTFEVTVTSANRAPAASAAIPDQSVEEGTQVTVDVSGAFSDPDGDALHYEATSDASSVATASVSGSDVTVTGEAPGSATITVTATDPGGLSAIQTFEVTVTSANRAPAASAAIPDQSVEEGTQVTVDVSGAFSDPDGDALSYEAASDASSVATASVSGSDVTVTGEAPGSATITVTATDPGGLSAIQTFEVTVDAASGGLDLNALFAPPTADEITQVKEEWDTRTPEVSGVRPELDSEVPAGLGSVRVRILSHTVGGHRHYGGRGDSGGRRRPRLPSRDPLCPRRGRRREYRPDCVGEHTPSVPGAERGLRSSVLSVGAPPAR